MNKLPRITVVTPSYNQGQYLERTICSVLNQNYQNLEYLVLDGGSKDNSREVIEKYAGHLSFWRSAPDGGQAAAIADGFKMATGEILCWVNSDDLLLPGCLNAVGEQFALYNDQIQWLIGGVINIDENNHILKYARGSVDCFEIMVAIGFRFAQPSCFWRKSLYDQVGGLDCKMQFCFDYDLFVKFARIVKVRKVWNYLSAFRLHSGAKTSQLEVVRQRENQIIRDHWKVKISSTRRYFHLACRAIKGKLIVKIPKEKRC